MEKTLLIICGPTAVGKTDAAIEVAKYFETEIISADSRQVYRELKIGTAAPTPEQMATIKHHLVGHKSIHDIYNVSIYENDAINLIEKLFVNQNILVLVGGSGLYIDVVVRGIDELPDIAPQLRRELRKQLEDNGLNWLQQQVERIDPEYWKEVDKFNRNRLLRALEVYHTTGEKLSRLRVAKYKTRPFKIIKTGLQMDREKLNKRVGLRVDEMVKSGLIDECKEMLQHKEANALNTVGYKEIFKYLEGKISLEQAIEEIKTNTRRYAKRQMTWFKKDVDIVWFDNAGINGLIEYVEKTI